MNTKFIARALVLLLFFGWFAVLPAQAQEPCSVTTLKGSYGFFGEGGEGIVLAPPGDPTPPLALVVAGIITFDGAGNLTGESIGNVNGWGAGAPGSFTGTYTVNPDCTYSGQHTGDGETLHFTGTISGSGLLQELHFIVTDPGWIALGTDKKVPPGGCSLGSLKGSYAMYGGGTVTSNDPPLPFRDIGIVNYDGAGNFAGYDSAMVGGMFIPDSFTGSATVTESCAVSIEINTTAYGVLHAMGWITGEGKSQEFHFIYTDPGLLAAGTLRKQ